jgi:predicted GH43/DUF377 family glycosyl hydrolase
MVISRPCRCDNAIVGPYYLGQCRICWIWKHEGALGHKYREAWKFFLWDQEGEGSPRRIQTLQFSSDYQRINPSLSWHKGKLWLAWRHGWGYAQIGLAELNPDTWEVSHERILDGPRITEDQLGREDPRLWLWQGNLHVTYSGLENVSNGMRTSVCSARIDREHHLVESRYEHYDNRTSWEKNWGFFTQDERRYCVYNIAPHHVFRMDRKVTEEYRTPFSPAWHPWSLRGGASPLLVGDEYYSFFHGVCLRGRTAYCVGLYTFDAEPPFRPRRMVQYPLLLPELRDRGGRGCKDVIYPGGAVLHRGLWLIAAGYYDRECRMYSLDAQEVEELLKPIPEEYLR